VDEFTSKSKGSLQIRISVTRPAVGVSLSFIARSQIFDLRNYCVQYVSRPAIYTGNTWTVLNKAPILELDRRLL